MADHPYLPLWTDAYIADTAHLTNEEHGVYLRLLMFAWRSPTCALPDDDARLALMVGVSRKKWAALRPTIEAFFSVRNGLWAQTRLTREREKVPGLSQRGRSGAEARWKGKSLENNKTGDAQASDKQMQNQCNGYAPIPITIKEEEGARAREADSRSGKDPDPATPEPTPKPAPAPALAPGLLEDIRSAVGIQPHDAGAYWSDATLAAHVDAWRAMGLSDDRIVAEARSSRAKNPDPPDGPKALDRWMEAASRAAKGAPKPQQRAEAKPPASPEDRLKFFADWINGERYLPSSAISTTLAQALIDAGLVTVAQLRKRGIAA